MNRDPEFQEHTVRLSEPAAAALRDAFAALPRRGCLECVCRWERRLEVLAALEESGAFAIRLEPADGFAAVRVVALKGKSGPCYDTGRRATYCGDAVAVLDDDRHLIVGTIRVCEKTGGLYALEPYRAMLRVTEADPALLSRLETDPVPFDCNTFDADSRRLMERLKNAQRPTPNAQLSTVVYPGPFRALVLADGSVVRRGVATRVTTSQADQNGLLRLPPERVQDACPCESYAAASRERGAAFILESLGGGTPRVVENVRPASNLTGEALAALRAAPRDFKQRLLQLIDDREPYWVMTGSDPDVAGGCCPSTQVGVANRLVRAGALQSYAPPAPPDACTATFYAFSGEITTARGDARPPTSGMEGDHPREPSFRMCEGIRQQAAAALRNDRWDGAKRAARVGLLMLLGVSLGLSAWRTLEQVQAKRDTRLCAVCAAAERLAHRMTGPGTVNDAAGAVSLGALAAFQPCALALFAGAVAVAWKPGAGLCASVCRNGAVAAGAGVSNAAMAVALAWGLAHALGDVAHGVQAFRGTLMILAGILLTGLFRVPVRHAAGVAKSGGVLGLFLLGATLGVLWCPVNAGLFAGVVLPSAIQHGTPVRNALLYGAGYAVPLLFFCAMAAAGGRLARLRSIGRFISLAAGWGLVFSGAVLTFA